MIPIHDISSSKKKDVILKELVTLTHYDSSEPHRHNYFEFFVFLKGGGIHEIDFVEFPIESNAIHIVAPGQVHCVKRELDSNGFVFIFESNLFDSLPNIESFLFDHICLDVSEFKPTYVFNQEFEKEIQFVTEKAWREYTSDQAFKNILVFNQLCELILYCMRQKNTDNKEEDLKSANLYSAFRRLLHKEFRTKKMVKDYSSSLNVTEKQLNELVHQRTGETVSTLIHKQLILEAKRLLRTGMSAKEVSYELNFIDPGHFSKFFKSQTNLSPTDFRNVHE